jgi:hypothetical protein
VASIANNLKAKLVPMERCNTGSLNLQPDCRIGRDDENCHTDPSGSKFDPPQPLQIGPLLQCTAVPVVIASALDVSYLPVWVDEIKVIFKQ